MCNILKNISHNDFYSLESEQFILSTLIVYNNSWNDVYTFLNVDSFYFKNHKIIFSIILDFLNFNLEFDIYSIYNKLKHLKDFDFLNYLNFLIQKLPNPSNILFYTSILHNIFILRKIFFCINKFLNNILYSKNINLFNLLEIIESDIFEINKLYIGEKNDLNWMGDIFVKYFSNVSFIKNSLFFTGFKDLDNILSGIHRGDLIIIAGRPSMGKTAFSLNIANYISNNYEFPIIIFSMEMSIQQLFIRILSLILDVNHNVIFGNLNENLININLNLFNKIYSSKIFIDETSNISILQIYSKCKLLIKEHGSLSLIIIDYLQLIGSLSNINQNRAFEVSEISRSLKCLAKELNIPVIAISQLNRNLELRSNKRPNISDLRESGSIEQDADVILFIYRDEIYNISDDNKNLAEIIISKHRNGSLGKIFLKFYGEKSKFVDFD
ncbi:replicative DNA helicase DnaB [Candidatus Nasuia deltocephalinicola]|uniref:Replicative DNA helicase n=1 Tax=Candidatus Nasuia deltocephalincola TaxID=1160784 RepID=A0A975A3Z7_9PROT|nr:replicative DNA helicase [Candidatus Nasuia deltocephalinicola]WKD87143.1 replicative DNA helicase [Candidatus Nasuia deltocephalinicola]BEH03923.1 replicative DNA helicase DnaB [Candidatus Nasuia deltocephalinicola]